MEVSPVKEAKPPKYPRMDEVSPEMINEAVPRRWMKNRAAKAALAALAVSALAGCAPEAKSEGLALAACNRNIAILVDGKELAVVAPSLTPEETAGQMAEETIFVTDGMPPQPTFSIWPYFAAAGCVLGIALWIRHKNKKRKRPDGDAGKTQSAESVTEPDDEEGEY